MSDLVGTPSDQSPEICAAGRGEITTLFVSMARRHPDGADADYLRWHSLDHRPEQHRLSSVRASLRLVSTPACRAARAAQCDPLDAIDHVMTYFFTSTAGLEEFSQLSKALSGAGRVPFVLAPVQRGVYRVDARNATARVKVGADVLPWWPAKGVYLLIEDARASPRQFIDVPGIAGQWSAIAETTALSNAPAGQRITYLFLDEDSVAVATRLKSEIAALDPLFAAPFHCVVPYEWDRYLP